MTMKKQQQQQEEDKQEQPVPEVNPKEDDDDDEKYDDDDDDDACFPCLACWQIIAIAIVVACVVIGIVVVAVVLLVTSNGETTNGGGVGGGGKVVEFPPDTVFTVEVQNKYEHGTMGTKTYDVTFGLKDGAVDRKDADPTTTDIRVNFDIDEFGVARPEVTVIIDFNVDGKIDCRDSFYPSVDVNSGDFGSWTSTQSCTHALGGLYVHMARVKVTAQ